MIKLNGVPVHTTIFPDKTSQVWKLPPEVLYKQKFTIDWTFENEGDIIQLKQLELLLHKDSIAPMVLNIKYLPYGRQDKKISNDATFALHAFASLINTCQFTRVNIMDPHSEEAIRLIVCSYAQYPIEQLKTAIDLTHSNLLCYPDAGALTKYSRAYRNLTVDVSFIHGEKVRDQATGNILSYKVVGECLGKNVLIVDDICDGGMTFKILAKDLLTAGAKSVNLFVTHGIFSKGVQTLRDSGIKRIFTQDGEIVCKHDNTGYDNKHKQYCLDCNIDL